MKMKKLVSVVLCLLIVFGFAACGDKKEAETITAPEGKSYPVQLYFANEKYIITGNENEDKLMKPIKSELKAAEGQQYEDVINVALRGIPKDNKGYETIIKDNIQFNSITVKDGTAYVDIKQEGLEGGSLEEVLLVDQIVETLVGSFPEIKEVQFLVDGEKVDSLMGHVDVTQPLKSKVARP